VVQGGREGGREGVCVRTMCAINGGGGGCLVVVGVKEAEVHSASEVKMQELKLFQGAATLNACRTSPPSFPQTSHCWQQP